MNIRELVSSDRDTIYSHIKAEGGFRESPMLHCAAEIAYTFAPALTVSAPDAVNAFPGYSYRCVQRALDALMAVGVLKLDRQKEPKGGGHVYKFQGELV